MMGDLFGEVRIAQSALIGEYCTFGCPKEARVRDAAGGGERSPGAEVHIEESCLIFNQVVLYEGVTLGAGCVVEDRVRVGYDTQIGERTRLTYGAYICDRVKIGADCTIAGFVCDAAVIGDRSTVMGELVHEYTHPHVGWWGTEEPPPLVEPDCVVGYGAKVIGSVRIGPCSYVVAGAIVTRNVPALTIVTGVNQHTPVSEWSGNKLQDLIGHWVSSSALDGKVLAPGGES